MAWSVPRTFKRALAWFQRLLGLSKQAQEEIEARCARRAKVAACAAQLRMVQMVWEASERAESSGTDFAAWKADFVQVLQQSWAAGGYRTAMVFDVAIQRGFAQSRVRSMLMDSVRRVWPFWMFEAVLDQRTSLLCDALHGVIRPAGEAWWERRTPPLHPRCFPPGTLITTAQGPRPIESLRRGDLVLTHRLRFRPVVETFASPAPKRLLRLTLASGRELTGTATHPALTDRGWVELASLRPGDHLFYVGEVPVQDGVVQDGHGQQPGAAERAQAGRWHAPAVLRQLDGEVGARQVEVDEEQVIPYLQRLLELVGAARPLQPRGEQRLRATRRGVGLGVRAGVLAVPALLRLVRLGDGVGAQQPSALRKLLRRAGDAGVRLLRVALAPCQPGRGALAGEAAHLLGGALAPLRLALPLVRDGLCAAPDRHAVLVQDEADAARRGCAQDRHQVLERLPLVHVQPAQVGPEPLPVRREEPLLRRVVLPRHEHPCSACVDAVSSIIEIDSADSQVFNIGVADDESYVASGYIVHNCRSHVRGLSSEEAHRRGVTWWYPEPRAEPGWGVLDEEYLPAPDGVPQELWDVFQRAISDE